MNCIHILILLYCSHSFAAGRTPPTWRTSFFAEYYKDRRRPPAKPAGDF